MQQRRPVTTISVDIGKSATRVRMRFDDEVLELVGRGLEPREALADDLGELIAAVITDTLSSVPPVDPRAVTAVVVGSTVYPETEQHRLLPALRSRWPHAQLIACEDGVTAHAGALGAPGTVVSAGTGTIVVTLTPSGRWSRVDGWGPVFGDRGSAYALGLAALRHTYAARDRVVPADALADAVAATIGGAEMATAQRWLASDHLWARVSDLARVVCDLAETDPASRILVTSAADDAARSAAAGHAAAADAAAPEDAAPVVCLTGRLALSPVYRLAFEHEAVVLGLDPRPPAGSALDGAERLPDLPLYHSRCVVEAARS